MVNGHHPLESVVERLREVKIGAGLTNGVLEDRAGLPSGRISHWETGRARPSLASLLIWAQALGCKIELGGSPVPHDAKANGEFAFLTFLQSRHIEIHLST